MSPLVVDPDSIPRAVPIILEIQWLTNAEDYSTS